MSALGFGNSSRAIAVGLGGDAIVRCVCGARAVITIGALGQTIETCSSSACAGSQPHPPTPDLTSPAPRAHSNRTKTREWR